MMTAARTPDSVISVMSFMKRANSLLKRIAPLQGMDTCNFDIFYECYSFLGLLRFLNWVLIMKYLIVVVK